MKKKGQILYLGIALVLLLVSVSIISYKQTPALSGKDISVQGDYSNCDYNLSSCKTSGWEADKVYCLNQSISATGTCMQIDNDSVTLDCESYSIIGDATGYGILNSGYDNVTIKNCNISSFSYGIDAINGPANNTYFNNTIKDMSNYGIYLTVGVAVNYSNNISSNSFDNSSNSIYLWNAYGNVIDNNIVNNTGNYDGITIRDGNYNNLSNNIIENVQGDRGIFNSNSNYTLIQNNNLTNCSGSYGAIVFYAYSEGVIIKGNRLVNNNYGLYNNINPSNNLKIYNNYFSGNTINAIDSGSGNFWNTTKTSGINILGGSYIGGNSWSDYSGTDSNGDGIGDTEIPYNASGNISNGGDYLPLTTPNVECGTTINDNFIFNKDLQCNGTALIIGADNVVLDCNGYNITGNATGYGISVSNYNNVTIKNCLINNFTHGIRFILSSGNDLINNTFDNCLYYDIFLNGNYNNLINNTLFGEAYSGIYIDGTSHDNLFKSNNISGNFQDNGLSLRIDTYNNSIYNNFFNNTKNIDDDSTSGNYYNTTYNCTSGSNIIGGMCLGGNYWSDYNGTDTNGDGIGDTEIPYNASGNISNGGDYLPLVQTSGSGNEDNGESNPPGGISGSTGYWDRTVSVSDSDFLLGKTLELGEKERAKVKVLGVSHYVGVIDIIGSIVKINVSSTPQQALIGIGNEKKFDVNNDSYYDIYVKLNNISNNDANLTIKSIHESIPVTPAPVPPQTTPIQNQTPSQNQTSPVVPPEEKSLFYWIIIGGVVLLIIILIIIFILKKRRESQTQEEVLQPMPQTPETSQSIQSANPSSSVSLNQEQNQNTERDNSSNQV